jgi:hypothetical protein
VFIYAATTMEQEGGRWNSYTRSIKLSASPFKHDSYLTQLSVLFLDRFASEMLKCFTGFRSRQLGSGWGEDKSGRQWE